MTVPNTKANTLTPYIQKYIKRGSTIFTDGWEYGALRENYTQLSVDHGSGFYGTMAVDTNTGECVSVTTNSIENVWSHFKRTIFGTYYKVSKKHLQRYVDEFVFRFNTRSETDFERFNILLQNVA